MRLRPVLVVAGAAPLLGGCALVGLSQLGSDEDGALRDAVAAADDLAVEGIEAIGARGPGVRWAGPSSSVSRCGGDFDIARYSINGTVGGRLPSEEAVASAWEVAGLEAGRDEDDGVVVTRGGAEMSYLVVPARVGPDVGRFDVTVDCTSAPDEEIDDLEEGAARDLGEDLGLRRIRGFE